jgi:hypothetical protein
VGEFDELSDRYGLHVPAVGDCVRITAPRSLAGLCGSVVLVDVSGPEALVELDGGRNCWIRARDLVVLLGGDR